jgi:hypothetical protein
MVITSSLRIPGGGGGVSTTNARDDLICHGLFFPFFLHFSFFFCGQKFFNSFFFLSIFLFAYIIIYLDTRFLVIGNWFGG